MITTLRRRPHRRSARQAALAALGCAGVLALAGAATTAPGVDPLVCFVDGEGRAVRIGDTVKDRSGREIGWISGTQCAPGAPRDKLRIVPNVYGAADPIEVDASALLGVDNGVVLALTPDELHADRQYASSDRREAPS